MKKNNLEQSLTDNTITESNSLAWRITDEEVQLVIEEITAKPVQYPRGKDLGHSIMNAAVNIGLLVPAQPRLPNQSHSIVINKKPKTENQQVTKKIAKPQEKGWRERVIKAVRSYNEFALTDIYAEIEKTSTALPTHYKAKVRQILGKNPEIFKRNKSGKYTLQHQKGSTE